MFLNFSDALTMSAVRPGCSFATTFVNELHKVSMFLGCMCEQCIGKVMQIYILVPATTCAHDCL